MISATILADSITQAGHRLTTLEVTFHRFILAELNTHRVFSRNSASSRAIPTNKRIESLIADPAFPVEFGINQPGMSASDVLEGQEHDAALECWIEAMDNAITTTRKLADLGVHKQVTNRLLEPFQWHTAIISATEWDNFFDQRVSEFAQPEMHLLALAIQRAYTDSKPDLVQEGDWHLPFITSEELIELPVETLLKVSVARCARVSYLNHNGQKSIDDDIKLHDKLVIGNHHSPFEHVATPSDGNYSTLGLPKIGNFTGWMQLRHSGIQMDMGF
jgi:thymidylate synthase ThyX